MIRLTLPEKPVELTAEAEAALVAEFIASQKAVWRKPFITTPLLEMTEHKCAYCERRLGEGVNTTFDHYVHKSHSPERVVEWGNLLPCCQSCNSSKGTYPVLTEPFFSPVNARIQAHFEMTAGGLFKGVSPEGKMVRQRLRLNDSDQKAPLRFRLIQAITALLEECDDLCESLEEVNEPRQRTKLRTKLASLLALTRRNSEFSATAATVLLHDPRLMQFKTCLERLDDWDLSFDKMLAEAREVALVMQVRIAPE